MTVLNIYALDDTETQNIIASLGEGKHVLGRGGILNVTDKRVSRKHAIIEVSNNKVTLLAVHMNPCFFKAFSGRTLTVITQNQEIELNDADQFALLPEDYWFEVKIQKDNLEEPHVNGKGSHNTNLEEDNLASDSKKGRWSIDTDEYFPTTCKINYKNNHINEISLSKEDEEMNKTNNEVSMTSLHFQETQKIEDIETEGNNNANTTVDDKVIKEEPQIKENDTVQNAKTSRPAVKVEPDDKASESGAQNTIKRERCLYGATCPRKNPIHRAFLSHPGDQDFDCDPDDCQRCPYGGTCHRCNNASSWLLKCHFRRHSPPKKKRAATKKAKPPQAANSPSKKKRAPAKQASDSEYVYEYSDPFLNDGSSDDFQPSDYSIDSSDSDGIDTKARALHSDVIEFGPLFCIARLDQH